MKKKMNYLYEEKFYREKKEKNKLFIRCEKNN